MRVRVCVRVRVGVCLWVRKSESVYMRVGVRDSVRVLVRV